MTQIKSTNRGGRNRVSKADWLNAALELLRTAGIEAVRVERLAATLGVAKSGFYYHFRDRADLHAALLNHWLSLDATPIVESERVGDASPAEKLKIIVEAVDRDHLSRYDAAIRQWAQHDPKVRRIWRSEMKKRFSAIHSQLAAIGFEGEDLEMRTRLFLAYHVSERDLFPDMSARERARLREHRLKLILAGAV